MHVLVFLVIHDPVRDQTSMETDMFSCDDCGLMFGKLHDLQKHAKKWCSENQRKPTFERNCQPKVKTVIRPEVT